MLAAAHDRYRALDDREAMRAPVLAIMELGSRVLVAAVVSVRNGVVGPLSFRCKRHTAVGGTRGSADSPNPKYCDGRPMPARTRND
jgi:hypothetical protein